LLDAVKPKIGLVTLGVRDLKRSLTFYRDGLGWPTHDYNPDAAVAFFPLEGTWLAIHPRQMLAADAGVPDGHGFGGITLAHNEPSEAEVDTAYARALAAGAKQVKSPAKTAWGGYSGYFADPDGYLWEIAFNPFMDLT
jgi:catechol 2,3-dioxygenase-like lactoylglutathione lyase family enzyme